MAGKLPTAELDSRYSAADAVAVEWTQAAQLLSEAEIYWLSTVRPDGRPHVTPLIAVFLDGAMYFCTGVAERKAMNVHHNPNCVLTTGRNEYGQGLDVVLEGPAVSVSDEDRLREIAAGYESKYGSDWRFEVANGAFEGGNGPVEVYELLPVVAFGFGRGTASQTRWRFQQVPD